MRRPETAGLDWQDVREYVTTVEAFHGGQLHIRIEPTSMGAGVTWQVSVELGYPDFVGPGKTGVCRVAKEWPSVDHRTLEGCVFALVMALDQKVGRCYRQVHMDEAHPPHTPDKRSKPILSQTRPCGLDKMDLLC